jgi:photosystem II stability/assembly factor-like uncharacterized protein
MKKLSILIIGLLAVNGAMAQFILQNSGTTNALSDVFFLDTEYGYAVGASGTILKTIDGGDTWLKLNSGDTADFSSVYFTSYDTGYIVGQWGYEYAIILKTMDGGANWSKLAFPGQKVFYSVHFPNPNTGFVVGDSSYGESHCYLLKTIDGGITWESIETGILGSYLAVNFPSLDTGYIAGLSFMTEGGLLMKTTNAGTSWDTVRVSSLVSYRALSFIDASQGFMVGYWYDWITGLQVGLIWKTMDGGVNWTSSSLPYLLNDICFPSADTGYVTGYHPYQSPHVIFRSTNGGETWDTLYTGSSSQVTSVMFPTNNTGYLVGGHGTILKTTDGGGPPIGIEENLNANPDLRVYPNPASTYITIETNTDGKLTILNLNGQPLLQQEITEPKTCLDVHTLPSGIYIVKITGHTAVQIGKLVKQ